MGAASKRKRLLEIASLFGRSWHRTIKFPFTAISGLAESMKAFGRKVEESQILDSLTSHRQQGCQFPWASQTPWLPAKTSPLTCSEERDGPVVHFLSALL